MNQRDLAKDKEMCEAATPGIWFVMHHTDIEVEEPAGSGYTNSIGYCGMETNAHFIAEARQALPYYIANYEDAIHLLEFDKNALEKQDALIERLRGRIKELEALLHPNNRPDVVTRLGHDTALETVFKEMEALKDG